MHKIILIIILILGGFFTFFSIADASNPGDVLYVLDTKLEKVRLSLASTDYKSEELKFAVAQERIEEIQKTIEKQTTTKNITPEFSFKSDKQKIQFEDSLESVSSFVENSDFEDAQKQELANALNQIATFLALNPNTKIEIETSTGVKIEAENGKVEIKTKSPKSYSSFDDSDDSDDSLDDHGNDSKENENEVFCDGEWRDPEDCEEGNDDSDDDLDDSDDSDDENDSDDDSDDSDSDDSDTDSNDDDSSDDDSDDSDDDDSNDDSNNDNNDSDDDN